MLLAVDVGNTQTVFGLYDGDQLGERWRIATEAQRTGDELGSLLGDFVDFGALEGICLSSTVPRLIREYEHVAERWAHAPLLVIGPGVRTGIHVGVDVLINRLSDANRRKFVVIGLAAGALFTGLVAALGAGFVWENGAHHAIFKLLGLPMEGLFEGPTTPDLEWPTWMVYSAIPLGTSLMCFRFLQVMVNFLKTGELPHHDHGHVDGLEGETA